MANLEAIVGLIWRASWQASVLFLLIVCVVGILGKGIAPQWRFTLFFIVIVRLLIFVTPPSPISLFALLKLPATYESQPHSAAPIAVPTPIEMPSKVEHQIELPRFEPRHEPSNPPAEPPPVASIRKPIYEETGSLIAVPEQQTMDGAFVFYAIAMVWLLGALFVGGRCMKLCFDLRRLLRVAQGAADPKLLRLFSHVKSRSGVAGRTRLLICPQPISPFVCGILQPSIVVPESICNELSDERIEHIFVHEFAHLRRGDVLTNRILWIARIFYWFHPIVWLVVRQLELEREAASDEVALATIQGCDRRNYVATILRVANGFECPRFAAGMVGFLRDKRLWRRVERIAKPPARWKVPRLLARVLCLLLALMGLTDRRVDVRADEPQIAPEKQALADPGQPHKTHVIRGRCIDGETNRPMRSIRFRLYARRGNAPDSEPEFIKETVSDENGNYEFSGLEPRREYGRADDLRYVLISETPEGQISIFDGFPPSLLERTWHTQTSTSVAGTVVDYQGKPVPGVVVTRFSGQPVNGIGTSVTDSKGRFQINNLTDLKRGNGRPRETSFRLIHPDFPIAQVRAKLSDREAVLKLPRPCHIRGTVYDKDRGNPAPGVLVNTHHLRNGMRSTTVRTNDKGQYHFVVQEGLYYVTAVAEARVCRAIEDVEVFDGETVELPRLLLERGGFITGQVVDGNTGKPIATNKKGDPLQIGLFGPSKPFTKVISQAPKVIVEPNGRFVVRAVPGENFLYFVNERGDQMAWNTRKQGPVLVKEGKRTRTQLTITPPVPKEKKMELARELVKQLAKDPEKRTRQIIAEFRKLNHTVDETEIWCSLMRELVKIGSPAVPHLLKELETTQANRMMRRLGFALRAIDDKRAIPGLIRAIPKSLVPACSDYGLIVDDAELSQFMQKHDNNRNRGGRHFSLGRPVREVFSALHELTGKNFDDHELFSIHLREHPREQHLQRSLFHQKALAWTKWWNANWSDFDVDEEYGPFTLPTPKPFNFASQKSFTGEFTPGSKVGDGTQGMTLSPLGEAGTKFLDLDTGYQPRLNIEPADAARQETQLAEWARTNGVDLMCTETTSDDGKVSYQLRGFGLRLWRIQQRDVKNLEKRLGNGTVALSPHTGDILFADIPNTAESSAKPNASFVFATEQGGLGVIEITDQITKVQDLTGMPAGMGPRGVGFFKGVKFNYHPIYPPE